MGGRDPFLAEGQGFSLADELEPGSVRPPPFQPESAYDGAVDSVETPTGWPISKGWIAVAALSVLTVSLFGLAIAFLISGDDEAVAESPPTPLPPVAAAPTAEPEPAQAEVEEPEPSEPDDLLHIGEPPPWVDQMTPRRRARRAREAMQRAHRLTNEGNLTSAEAWFRRAYHLRPESGAAASLIARNLAAQGRHAEAEAWAQHAIEIAPRVAFPYYHQGRVHEDQDEQPPALESYSDALERNPNERRVLRRLRAIGQERLSDTDESR